MYVCASNVCVYLILSLIFTGKFVIMFVRKKTQTYVGKTINEYSRVDIVGDKNLYWALYMYTYSIPEPKTSTHYLV